MEGMGDSYGDLMQRVEESPSCSSMFKQKISNNKNNNGDNNSPSSSISVPGPQGISGGGNRHGIPQSHHHPPPSPFGPTSPSLLQSPYTQLPFSGSFATCNSQPQRPSHSRSLSQPAFLSLDQSSLSSSSSVPEPQLFDRLPPISPASMHGSKRRGVAPGPATSSSSEPGIASMDASVENQNLLGHNRPGVSPAPSAGPHCTPPLSPFGSGGAPGAKRGHRRTHSEVPYIFSQHSQSLSPQLDQLFASGVAKDRVESEHNNRDGDLKMEASKGEFGHDSCNASYDMHHGDIVKNSEGLGNDAKDRAACKGSETSDVVMRSAEGSDGTHMRTDSGGSEVKEKNDKDADWISSDDEADSEANLMGNQNRNASSFERKEGNGHQSFGGSRHNRSASMDSILSNNIHSLSSGKDLKLSPSQQNQSGRDIRRSSTDGNISLKLELGGEFTEAELKKILSNEKLTEIARSDPRRAKRILANRLSAARSKERKMLYISELEGKVQTLQTEATTLSAQLTLLQRDLTGLASENSGLKLRLQGMEQQAQLQDALNKALMEEVQRLKMATGQPVTEQSAGLANQMSLNSQQLFQLQQHGLQQQQVEDNVQSSGQNMNQNVGFTSFGIRASWILLGRKEKKKKEKMRGEQRGSKKIGTLCSACIRFVKPWRQKLTLCVSACRRFFYVKASEKEIGTLCSACKRFVKP